MKVGDLVRLIPEDEYDDYEGLIGFIVSEELGVMGNGRQLYFGARELEIIDETG